MKSLFLSLLLIIGVAVGTQAQQGFASKVRIRCWRQSVPPAVAGGCAAFKPVLRSSAAAQLRTHPLPQVVLTISNGISDFWGKAAQQSKYQKEEIRQLNIKKITSVDSTKQKFVSDYDRRGNLVRRVGFGPDGSTR